MQPRASARLERHETGDRPQNEFSDDDHRNRDPAPPNEPADPQPAAEGQQAAAEWMSSGSNGPSRVASGSGGTTPATAVACRAGDGAEQTAASGGSSTRTGTAAQSPATSR